MTSKYVGNKYSGWECTKIMLTTTRGGGTRHNYYRYNLQRKTSDDKFMKVMTVSESVMRKISRGINDPDAVAEFKKKYYSEDYPVLYKFLH